MKKILVLTDLHGNYGKMEAFLGLDPDFVLISGDLTEMGPVEPAIGMLESIDVPCFVVPGNCDPKDILEQLEDSSAVSMHGNALDIGNITFVGLGGSNPTPFCTPFELQEEEIEELLFTAEKRMRKNVHNILISHAPPFGTLDNVGGNPVGSTALKEHMKNYDLICCGHIHDDHGVKEIDGTVVVNPGPASDGRCAMITLGEDAKDIRVELYSL
ncbi:metallophosphoesterase family protein [Methanoplanus endosymbiosus]|uniref:Metallophosphoesterase n=1 Tax=Methanoplanus endosymbiosus TaxID=33865 RepID=A0A9E7TGW9_9EURY|nr:metallophosphoesterase [Methanoplanus endosymbiosus]UUX91842.1 metallophosphoesterase [Methanoplanus endosymbiosus]